VDNLGELLRRLALLSFLEVALPPGEADAVTHGEETAPIMGQMTHGAMAPPALEGVFHREKSLENTGTEIIGSASPVYIENRLERVAAPTLPAEEISRYFERDARRYG